MRIVRRELGESMNDPFDRNFIPAWGNVGQLGGCPNLLEVNNPVTGIALPITINGFTYHPEDFVFQQADTSTSVSGQFTFLNSFAACPGRLSAVNSIRNEVDWLTT